MSPSPVIIVTGGSRGIGLAVVGALLKSYEARVVALSRTRTPEISALASEHPDSLALLEGDVTQEQSAHSAVELAKSMFGRLDGLILNAGTLDPLGRIDSPECSVEGWKSLFDINFFSLLHLIKAGLPLLRESSGRIIFVSSGAATGGIAGWGPYNASKAAMNSLARTLANEEKDVVSVAVRPGVVDTEMQSIIRSKGLASMKPEEHSKFTALHAESQLVKPEDTGHVIAGLSVGAKSELSGTFIDWQSDEVKEFRRKE
ncbi:short-chain dehydrogenase/reductase, putative [Rhizoctonia solani AG-3 Rhs1AP]|uniref:Short-chain dehydrogenase/reductase, putative n=2 Tax=Rhizoctonia solani AG-3 TaxID=1086053 RepID=X8JRE5_9AGAM|nr:short-chain dehydrogenase/reductase, putative [Rhizoctonia solani AG-3 Rhs1AP]KEP55461.1 putative short-chain dehydrogenase/reductase [Rhizoctonia solani 123E]